MGREKRRQKQMEREEGRAEKKMGKERKEKSLNISFRLIFVSLKEL